MVSEHKIKLLCTGNKFSQSAQMFRTVGENEECLQLALSSQPFISWLVSIVYSINMIIIFML